MVGSIEMGRFPVNKKKEKDLLRRMENLKIFEKDLEESFIRSSGPGGQKVNKTNSAVQLVHKPSGIEVKVDQERSQGLNRFLARRILVEKLEKKILGKNSKEEMKREKFRRQKNRRKRKSKKKYSKN